MPYNTALRTAETFSREALGDTAFAESARGTVFAHDLCQPLPTSCDALIGQAECIMADIAWKHGWPVFYERAGRSPGDHDNYLYNIKALIDHFAKPAFIVGSAAAADLWRPPLRRPILLNGGHAVLSVFHTTRMPIAASAPHALALEIAQLYPSVYDFSCGYGNYLRPFRHFIGSDIDTKCLNYIAGELL